MPAVNPAQYHMSASSIASFKACPTRFRLAYREGLRLVENTESQRVGTNWHAMHEEYARALSQWDALDAWWKKEHADAASYALNSVVLLLNDKYQVPPASKTVHEWALERQVLLTSFVGYLWFYQNDPVEFLASEVPFELPIHLPRTGLPLPTTEVLRVGKIDHVIKWQGSVCSLERKSTSRSIGADSDYWDKAKKDTQVSMYALAFRDMMKNGVRLTHDEFGAESYRPTENPLWSAMQGKAEGAERIGNTLYDVWHKPTIKPAPLTQAETKAFIENGEYCGHKFEVLHESAPIPNQQPDGTIVPSINRVTVNGQATEIEPGKKGFSIRETVEMFGARLLQDIFERPDFYYQRREIARTDMELAQFRQQLFAVYTAQKAYAKSGCWFENESQCRATFPCSYIPICYGPGADAVCDGKTTPAGFKRIFVDLTVNGESTDD